MMRVLIVEDERPTAEDIRDMIGTLPGLRFSSIQILTSLHDAQEYLSRHPIDVLLLDLNLNERDGFDLLKQSLARAFHTIVISAYADRAIEAFEHGVLDFVLKPYNRERLAAAFARLQGRTDNDTRALKYLSVRAFGNIEVVPLADVLYFRGANVYSEIHLRGGGVKLYDKSLKNLLKYLPRSYVRIHKSYIAEIGGIRKVLSHGSGRYEIELENGAKLPLSRNRAREIKSRIIAAGAGRGRPD